MARAAELLRQVINRDDQPSGSVTSRSTGSFRAVDRGSGRGGAYAASSSSTPLDSSYHHISLSTLTNDERLLYGSLLLMLIGTLYQYIRHSYRGTLKRTTLSLPDAWSARLPGVLPKRRRERALPPHAHGILWPSRAMDAVWCRCQRPWRSQQLLQALAADVAQEFLAADGEQSAAGFKTRTTVGIMFDRCVIDNMVVGGPAYNSRQLDRGDLVVEIDGRPVDKDSLSQMLVGKDVAGTPVAITVKKGGKTGAKKTVTLLRMPSEAIADRRRLFELFTTMKARATLPRGRETVEGMIDNAIELWTRMTVADSDRDARTRSKVAGMQERAQGFVTELMQNDEAKRALYFERHDDVLQLGDRVEHAQLETARLTLALKEAEAENDRLKEANQELEEQLREAKRAIETLNKDAADAAAESEASRAKGMGERMEMDKLKREFALQETTIQNQQQLKRDLEAQIERLTKTVSEVNEQLQKAWTDAEIAEANFVKTVTGLKKEKAEIGADC